MAQRETGKQRANRIPLDYYKHPDWLVIWKWGFTLLAIALAGLYLAGGWAMSWARGLQGEQRFSHGPVASVHQAWETRCEVCHVPFHPIKDDTWLTPFQGKPLDSDAKCQACHAGPAHNGNQLETDVVSCGTCHRDHQGRMVSLVNLPDSDCTSCHAELKNHRSGTDIHYKDASSFSMQGHPPFATKHSKESDPGRIKFDHQVHSPEGMPKDQTLGKILDTTERERYRAAQPDDKKEDTDQVVLKCASCHRLDSREGQRRNELPARSQGDLMLPVNYEISCKACHPLTFDKKIDAAIPHHLQPDQVRAFVWGELAKQKIKDLQSPAEKPLPGKPLREQEKTLRDEITGKVGAAETFLYQRDVARTERYLYSGKTTCGECHQTDNRAPDKIVPPQRGDLWFPHAKFNHTAHRAVNCAECHQLDSTKQGPENEMRDKRLADMTFPAINNCVQCHAPASTVNGKPQGGVRFNCTECHRYHHGEEPLQGVGASKRDVPHKRTIESFLSGTSEP